jgi:O-antigen ligase
MFIVYAIVIIVGFIQIPSGRRISAPFEGNSGEPNTLGGYLTIMMSLNILLFLYIKSLRIKIFLGILAVLSFIALLYTLSRASWIAFTMMYTVLIILTNKRKLLVLFLAIGMIIAPFTLPEAVVDRFLYTFQSDRDIGILSEYSIRELEVMYQTGDLRVDTSTQARLNDMKQSIQDFQKKPLLGYGVTGYMFLDAQFHRLLIETGIIGLSSFLYLLWVLGKTLISLMVKYRNDILYRVVLTGTVASFFGMIAHSIGTNSFIIVRIMEPFWCLVGLCYCIPKIEESEAEVDHKSIPVPKSIYN